MHSTRLSLEQKTVVLDLVKNKVSYKIIAQTIGRSVSCVKSIVAREKFSASLPPKETIAQRLTDGRIGKILKDIIREKPNVPYRALPGLLMVICPPGTKIPSASTCRRYLVNNGFKVVKLHKKCFISSVNQKKGRICPGNAIIGS